MAKKIHITEEQRDYIMKALNEDNTPLNIDATADVAAASGNASVGMKKAKQRLQTQGFSGKDATISCDSDAIMENCGKPLTKRQINEFKLRQLKESSICYSKKQIDENKNIHMF